MNSNNTDLGLLAIVAHPDDAELLCGGTLLRALDAGHRTGILDLTGGEYGTFGTVSKRKEESEAAAKVLGLAARRNAELPDGSLVNSPEARLVVAQIIRELRPRTVIVQWTSGRHPDHTAASQLAYDACFVSGLKRAPIEGEPFRPQKVIYALSFREDVVKPTFVVDITKQIDRKIDAIFSYASQFENKTAMGEVFGGGNRPLRDQILAHAAHYGSLIRCAYGEPFWTRETMIVDDVVTLGVPSI